MKKQPPSGLPRDLEDVLTELIGGQFFNAADRLTAETDLFAAGLDSMSIMQMVTLIEENWGIALPFEDLTDVNFRTPRRIAALLRQRVESAL